MSKHPQGRGAKSWAKYSVAERETAVSRLSEVKHRHQEVIQQMLGKYDPEFLQGVAEAAENVAQIPRAFGLHLSAASRQDLMQWSAWMTQAAADAMNGDGDD